MLLTRGRSLAAKAWSNEQSFFLWLRWFAWQVDSMYPEQRRAGKHILLLVDGHSSRLNPDMLQWAADHRIILLCYPPNATSLLQGLDVAVHGVLKTTADGLWNDVFADDGEPTQQTFIEKVIFPAWDTTFSEANLKKAFQATGCWPINRAAIGDDKLRPSQLFTKDGPGLEEFVQGQVEGKEEQHTSLPLQPMPEALKDVMGKLQKSQPKEGTSKQPGHACILTRAEFITQRRQKLANSASRRRGGGRGRGRGRKRGASAMEGDQAPAAPAAFGPGRGRGRGRGGSRAGAGRGRQATSNAKSDSLGLAPGRQRVRAKRRGRAGDSSRSQVADGSEEKMQVDSGSAPPAGEAKQAAGESKADAAEVKQSAPAAGESKRRASVASDSETEDEELTEQTETEISEYSDSDESEPEVEESKAESKASNSSGSRSRASSSSAAPLSEVKDGAQARAQQAAPQGAGKMMEEPCVKCQETPTEEGGTLCNGCGSTYHKSCVGASRRKKVDWTTWHCSKAGCRSFVMPAPEGDE
jgi:hypothetical protein